MTTVITGAQVRNVMLGRFAANAAGKALPQNATSTIFTVAGGRILITSLTGAVTTIVAGTTPPIKLVATPTVGTAADMCAALTITGTEVGTMFALPGLQATALYGAINKSGAVSGPIQPQIVAAGTIGVNCTAADATGAIQWSLTWVPLDAAATVPAA